MELIFNSNMSLIDIRGAFNALYPYLKLEFFSFREGSEEKFSRENLVDDLNMTLHQLGNGKEGAYIRVNGNIRTGQFEDMFKEKFGVHVQVFRKTGTSWLETSQTDDWTLDEQDKAGMESSSVNSKDIFPDYDLYHEQL